MTISTTTSRITYAGDGVSTVFAVPFVFFGQDELEVIEKVTATGVEVTKVLTTHYAVAGGNGAAGSVTALAAPAGTVSWTIARKTKQTQEVDYTPNDPFPAETHERALDRLTALVQELADKLNRALVLSVTSAITSLPLPNPVADWVLGWKSDGSGIENKQLVLPDSIVAASIANTRTGTASSELVTPDGLASLWQKGSDIVAAASLAKPTDTNLGGYHVVTGTGANISALWSGEAAGAEIELRFSGANNLVHHATNLILPAAANVTTAAGDVARFRCEASGQWRCVSAPPRWFGASATLGGNGALAALMSVIANALPPRGIVNGKVDGFSDQTGVDTAASTNEIYEATGDYYTNLSAPSTTYANAGGQGDRTGSITVASTISSAGGTLNNLVDGATGDTTTDAMQYSGTAVSDGQYFRFDFGSAKYIDEVTLNVGNALTINGWAWEGSNDATNWTSLGSFNWTTNPTQVIALSGVPAGGFRYYQMKKVGAGTMATFWFREVTFKIAAPSAPVDLVLLSTAIAASSAPTDVGIVLLHQAVDAVTVNSDLVAAVSRDGGTSWANVSLVDCGSFDGTYRVLRGTSNVAAQPAGTAVKWRVTTQNTKQQRVKGVSVDWS